MKAFKILLSLIPIVLIFSITSCKKNKNIAPIDQLPPETQTGKNTFGCLVDGKVFVPKGFSLHPRLTCYYQYIYPSPNGYVFQVAASDFSSSSFPIEINIFIDSVKIKEGQKIDLTQPIRRGNGYGNYRKVLNKHLIDYFTFLPSSGQIEIKKFDENNQIAAGTFWFNAVNENGDTVKVTDGRFDMQFTK